MRKPPSIPESEPDAPSVWDECPWFAIARFDGGACVQVFMTRDWDAYCREYRKLTVSAMTFTVWCGTFRDVEAFRKRAWDSEPHDGP